MIYFKNNAILMGKTPQISSIFSGIYASPEASPKASGGRKHKSRNFAKNIDSFLQNCAGSFRTKRTKPFRAGISIIAGAITALCLLGIIMPQTTNADFAGDQRAAYAAKISNKSVVVKKIKVIITAYSSTPEETDNTPFITASGKNVADGIVANNLLPFGTKIRIPGLYGDKIFIVEDRMNKRKGKYHVDIWFPSKTVAKNFGAKLTYIEVLEN